MIVCLGAAAILMGAALFFLQQYMFPEPSPMQERLMRFKAQQRQEEMGDADELEALRMSSLLKSTRYSNESLGRLFERYSFTAGVQRSLRQAGVKTPVDKFLLSYLVIPAGLGLVFSLFFLNPLPLLLGIVFFVMTLSYLKILCKKRLARLTTQLPDALNLITSSLRAGHSFQSALTIVVTELPDPISTEFNMVLNDINWGIPVKEALYKMVNSVDNLPDIRMFVTSLIIQRESGGNLAEVLEKLSFTIRERFKLQGQIKALTGQSRLTGYVLGCAPAGLFVFLFLFMRSYIEPLLNSPLGQAALALAAFMQIVGFLVMKKIVEIRV